MKAARIQNELKDRKPVSSSERSGRTSAPIPSRWPIKDIRLPDVRLGQGFGSLRPLQAKLTVSTPGDEYEQEADRVAEHVMRMPDPVIRLQRKCGCGGSTSSGGPCEECSKQQSLVQRSPGPQTQSSSAGATAQSVHGVLQSGGQPLDTATRAFMESRFNQGFGHVRIHTGPPASESARELQARAYTLGHDIVFGSGQYAPETSAGRKLLAHELTHVVQQRPNDVGRSMQNESAVVRERLPETTLAGEWIIDNPGRRLSPRGRTDAELLGDAFRQICPLASRSNDRITLSAVPPGPAFAEGCDCLGVIENDLASPSPAQSGIPHIQIDAQGWSTTRVGPGSPAQVAVRHPESSFEWGYWTGGQTRHLKPFWQTVAHEVCGHVAAFVRTRGTNVGARGVGMGHNIAIEGENRVAAEHGVTASEQRGLDFDPRTGRPLAGHRGESFLQATIFDFAHASDALPASASQVVSDAVNSVRTGRSTSGLELFIQVEGFAMSNEGGTLMAIQRAINVRSQIEAALRAQGISLTITTGSGASATTVNRFTPNLASIARGSSTPQTSNPGRRVQVYLFHQIHSAGP